MKKNILFLYILSLAVFSSYSAFAQSNKSTIDNNNDFIKKTYNLFQDYTEVKTGHRKLLLPNSNSMPASTDLRSGEQFQVTLEFVCSENIFPSAISIFGKGVKPINLRYNKKTGKIITIKLAKGSYGMLASFDAKPNMSYYIFKENVTINSDTRITFDQKEATNTIQVKTYDQNGTELTPDIYSNNTIKRKGNLLDLSTVVAFSHKEYGNIATILGGPYKTEENPYEFYINQLSDNYTYYQASNLLTKDNENYFILYSSKINKSVSLKNDPKKIKLLAQNFIASPAGMKEPNSRIAGFTMWTAYEGYPLQNMYTYDTKNILKESVVKFYMDAPVSDDGKFVLIVNPFMCDTQAKDSETDEVNYRFIQGLPVLGNTDGFKYIDYGYGVFSGFSLVPGTNEQMVFPGHPRFSFRTEEISTPFGFSCPINSVQSYQQDGSLLSLVNYIGRYGEVRDTDAALATMNQRKEGNFTIQTITNSNVKVDSINGKNITILKFDQSKPDFTPPTLQMLRFYNEDKKLITDIFSTKDEGLLEFAAGDFRYIEDATSTYFLSEAPEKVEVFYTKNGTNTWDKITAQENKDYYFMPGFGNFYQVSLKDMKEDIPNGWYDLKIILTDKTGNQQIQTIIPAFYIGKNNVSINDIANDMLKISREGSLIKILNSNGHANIKVYSLDGKIIFNQNEDYVNIQGLSTGTYVIVATEGYNKSVQKITIN